MNKNDNATVVRHRGGRHRNNATVQYDQGHDTQYSRFLSYWYSPLNVITNRKERTVLN